MAIAPCPVYGKHRMYSMGPTVVWDLSGNVIRELSGWYKCACNERFICGGYPHFGGSIYNYVTEGAIKGIITTGGVTGYTVDKSLMRYTTSKTLDGYTFLAQ
ncbi:hypothetical protein [Bacillus tuaregi]|uniref:hypothetical protein n=1 Tax=Bacillus tuaregi TaxID=1816695 RepID=UPI0008F7ED43|nr:hypothetical protein [Bacillus tuaregi]